MANVLKGMKDIYGIDSKKYDFIIKNAENVFKRYGYSNIITPILEETELFKRSVGDETDVVSKEMYSFVDKGDRNISMRPEGTAGVVRAYLEAGFHKSNPNVKWYYHGPMYRYEAPQKGRYREFHQIGVEAFGIKNPYFDAEIISMAVVFLNSLNIKDLVVELNTLGNVESRKVYISELQKYLYDNIDNLSKESKIRTEKNPLRVLDSKDKNDQKIIENAPKLYEYLDEDSKQYFEELKIALEILDIKYIVNEKLVRGLDYYTDTVFEIKSNKLGAQSTVLAGGRYDRLTEILGGISMPGIGFACGVERLSLILDENEIEDNQNKGYIIYFEETKKEALKLLHKLRKRGEIVEMDYSPKSFSAQMKKANKIGATKVYILGEEEVANNIVTVKDFKTGKQNILRKTKDEIFNENSIIKTERLILRHIKEEDLNDLFEVISNENVTKYLSFNSPKNIDEAKDGIKFLIDNKVYGIILKENNKLIGAIDFRLNNDEDTAGFGYNLNENYWNKGYMTEALNSIIKLLFDNNIRKIAAMHFEHNEASGKVMEKVGMKKVGIEQEATEKNGQRINIIKYEILNPKGEK